MRNALNIIWLTVVAILVIFGLSLTFYDMYLAHPQVFCGAAVSTGILVLAGATRKRL